MTIRDPSDGSVRHQPKSLEKQPYAPTKPVLDTGTSGLPVGSSKSKDLQKLEKSRDWLRDYKLKLVHRATEPALAPIGHQETENDAT